MKRTISSLEIAYDMLGRDIKDINKAVEFLPKELRAQKIADDNLDTLIEALNYEANGNRPWLPNFDDNTRKYEPIFYMGREKEGDPAGSGFSYHAYVNRGSFSYAGSRRVFIDYETMRYAVDNFLDVYKAAFVKQ